GFALAHVRLADRVQQAGLTVVDVVHDGDHRRTLLEVLLATLVLAVGQVEALEQLAVLVLGADDLDDVVHLRAEQLEGLVGHRSGGRDHLAQVEQRLDQCGRVGIDLVCEVRQRGAAGEPDGLAVAARQTHAAHSGGLHLVVLATLLPLGLAAAPRRAAGTTEGARRVAATAGATATAETADGTRGTTGTETAAATARTAATAAAPRTTGRTRSTLRHRTGRGPGRHVRRGRAGTARTGGRTRAAGTRGGTTAAGTRGGTTAAGPRRRPRRRGVRVVAHPRLTRSRLRAGLGAALTGLGLGRLGRRPRDGSGRLGRGRGRSGRLLRRHRLGRHGLGGRRLGRSRLRAGLGVCRRARLGRG